MFESGVKADEGVRPYASLWLYNALLFA